MIYMYAQELLNGGELSPRMLGRVSSERYRAGFAESVNFIATPHGPVYRRGGTHFVAEVKDSSRTTVLLPFMMGTGVKVVLELGHLYIRFYSAKAQVESGGAPMEVVSPYTSAQVTQVRGFADSDRIYLVHPNVAPQELIFTTLTSWTLQPVSFTSAPAAWTGTNWPSIVWITEQRLCFAKTPAAPHSFAMSKSGAKTNFTTGSLDDDAIVSSLADGAGFSWCIPGDKLLFGTNLYEGKIIADSNLSPLTPTNCYPRAQTYSGSSDIAPVRMDADILFLQRGARKLRRFGYRLDKDSYSGDDLTLPSEHITTGGLLQLSYINEPDGVVWATRADGQLIGMTYEPSANVSSWHRHIIGGTDAAVKWTAGVHGVESYKDELWLIVSRTINGATKQYVEYLVPGLIDSESIADCFFVDSGVSVDLGSEDTTVTGATHLVGETVQLFTDGYVQPPAVVDEYGVITLTEAARYVTYGLPYESKLKTVPIEVQVQEGSSQGKQKVITHLVLRLLQSLGVTVCSADESSSEELHFGPATVYDSGVELFDGDTEPIDVPQGYTPEGQIVIKQSYPLPLCIALIAYWGRIGD
jgi:hypothetical protein